MNVTSLIFAMVVLYVCLLSVCLPVQFPFLCLFNFRLFSCLFVLFFFASPSLFSQLLRIQSYLNLLQNPSNREMIFTNLLFFASQGHIFWVGYLSTEGVTTLCISCYHEIGIGFTVLNLTRAVAKFV